MKKRLGLVLIITIMILLISKEEKVVIPKEAIRFRVVANSNEELDQKEKKKIATTLGQNISQILKNQNSLNDARKTLESNINNFTSTIEEKLEQDNYETEVQVNYGMNYFPEKNYKGVTYEEGEYESLVVTLGKGEGNNFWCVLFPPLCLLEAEEEEKEEVEYTSFVKEILDKYF